MTYSYRGLVVSVVECGLTGCRFESASCQSTMTFSPVVHDWVIKGLMSSRVCVTGHIKDPVPLIEKSRTSCPSGRFSTSFIHQVILITGLNKLYDRPEDGLSCRQGVQPPLKLKP